MRSNIVIITALLSMLLTACTDPVSPRLMKPEPPPEKAQKKVQAQAITPRGLPVQINPRVDILFVIDNSRSMEDDINVLRKNIRSFANAMAKNPIMDYHIAATTVFDSSRFNNTKDGVFKTDPTDGKTLYLEKGELIPLKDASGKREWKEPRYVTRKNIDQLPSLFEIKKYDDKTRSKFELLVGWKKENKKEVIDGKEVYTSVAYGPEFEETLSPIQSVVWPENQTVADANKDFLRKDSLFVIIPLTDADSEDGIDPQKLFDRISESRTNDVIVVGLLCEPQDTQCRLKNPNMPGAKSKEPISKEIRKFIAASRKALPKDRAAINNEIKSELPIGSTTWGEELAKVGTQLKERVLKKSVYLGEKPPLFLPDLPDTEENEKFKSQKYAIEVYYGEERLPNNRFNGWYYDRITNTVTISDNIDKKYLKQKDAQIRIDFTEWNPGKDSELYEPDAE